jgi:hypothetical protein
MCIDCKNSRLLQGISTGLVQKERIGHIDWRNNDYESRIGYAALRADGNRPSVQDAAGRN